MYTIYDNLMVGSITILPKIVTFFTMDVKSVWHSDRHLLETVPNWILRVKKPNLILNLINAHHKTIVVSDIIGSAPFSSRRRQYPKRGTTGIWSRSNAFVISLAIKQWVGTSCEGISRHYNYYTVHALRRWDASISTGAGVYSILQSIRVNLSSS
jgi:hypothetical protein